MATPFNRTEIAKQRLASDLESGSGRDKILNAAGATTLFFALDPSRLTSIIVTHNSSDSPTVSVTNTLNSNNDIEDADALYAEVYDGTNTPYVAGDSKGLTGIKVIANPTNGDVEISIIQYGRRN